MLRVCEAFGLDPDAMTPGRKVVHHIGASLVKAMEMALAAGEPEAAEVVACECVTRPRPRTTELGLMSEVAKKLRGRRERR